VTYALRSGDVFFHMSYDRSTGRSTTWGARIGEPSVSRTLLCEGEPVRPWKLIPAETHRRASRARNGRRGRTSGHQRSFSLSTGDATPAFANSTLHGRMCGLDQARPAEGGPA
jgi:hypothetical protein